MIYCDRVLSILVNCLTVGVLGMGVTSSVLAEQKEQADQHKPVSGRIYGKVTQTMDAAGYTYAEVDTGNKKFWAAARKTMLNKGDMIAFSTVMPMNNYYSKSLNREFPVVYFVNQFITDKKSDTDSSLVVHSPHTDIKSQKISEPVSGINKIEGGHTIAEIYKNKQSLNGKTIRVRGKVTKFTANVMKLNWVHIMDSSTHNDLTITTKQTAKLNDVIVIEGKLELDKDYNYGYIYPLIVENASLSN